METNIAVFRGKEIRKTIHKNEWWFSIVDVIEALTGSERPRKYWNDLKNKLSEESYSKLSKNMCIRHKVHERSNIDRTV